MWLKYKDKDKEKTETKKNKKKKRFNYLPDLLPGTLYQLSLVETGGGNDKTNIKTKTEWNRSIFWTGRNNRFG